MQIVSLGVFGKTGDRRDVRFKLGALNILTGKSKTGKSAILDIAEYCLGRDTVTIPTGVISDSASWFYVLVQFEKDRVLICRPNPETASTKQAMIVTGGHDLEAVTFEQLKINADTDVIRDILTEHLGIESFTIDPEAGSLRQPFDVSVRQALFYCFQSQNEIGSRDLLFHRQVDNSIKATIRDTLPYFLGAATPEQGALRRQIIATRRTLQRTQNQIRSAQTGLDEQDGRITHLIESAVSLEILPSDASMRATNGVRELLEEIAAYKDDGLQGDDSEITARRHSLIDDARATRRRLNELDDQIELLKQLQMEQKESQAENKYQFDRLRAMDFILPKSFDPDGDTTVCPLCDQKLEHPDESIADLQNLLTSLERRLSASKGVVTHRDEIIEKLINSRRPLVEALRENTIELDAVAEQETAIAQGRERRERIAFLQGRVSQELERGVDIASDLTDLRNQERRYKVQLARLEAFSDHDNPELALRSTLDELSELMTDYARELQLEGSEYVVRLDPTDLTVVVQTPGGRVPLARMGSAENWVGYHLVAHLALHHWFSTKRRPVPSFVMFDQPTQAFFPEEVVDAAEDENADWEAVRRQFTLMRNVVKRLGGDFQIIASDHANLSDAWFQEAVIENWRNGAALIPSDWIENPTV